MLPVGVLEHAEARHGVYHVVRHHRGRLGDVHDGEFASLWGRERHTAHDRTRRSGNERYPGDASKGRTILPARHMMREAKLATNTCRRGSNNNPKDNNDNKQTMAFIRLPWNPNGLRLGAKLFTSKDCTAWMITLAQYDRYAAAPRSDSGFSGLPTFSSYIRERKTEEEDKTRMKYTSAARAGGCENKHKVSGGAPGATWMTQQTERGFFLRGSANFNLPADTAGRLNA